MSRKNSTVLPRYEEIARDIASRIANREYKEGDKLFGRSSLAGLYKVSPETIRRAVALLHSRGVVTAQAGSGIVVLSETAAIRYLDEARIGVILQGLQEEISRLLAERQKLDREIEAAIAKVLHYTSGTLATMRHVEEVPVGSESPLIGQTLTSADLRTRTGATVVGLARGREEHFSPDPRMEIHSGDLLIVVGTEDAKERLRVLAAKGLDAAGG